MWGKKSMMEKEEDLKVKYAQQVKPRLEPFIWSINQIARAHKTTIRCQGVHPVGGGLSVVSFELRGRSLGDARQLVYDLFMGLPRVDIAEYLERVRQKVEGAYVVELEVVGWDKDGDTLHAELRFPSQKAFEFIAEHGLFSIEDINMKALT